MIEFPLRATDTVLVSQDGRRGEVGIDRLRSAPASFVRSTEIAVTLDAGHAGKYLVLTAADPVAVTVPAGLPVGFACGIIQAGAGTVTIGAAEGVSVNASNGGSDLAQYAVASLLAISDDAFILAGDIADPPP